MKRFWTPIPGKDVDPVFDPTPSSLLPVNCQQILESFPLIL
jgi:hypothetical protein